jgi:hypothetical protein
MWYVEKQFGEQNFRGHAYSLIFRVDNMSLTIKYQHPAGQRACMYLHSPVGLQEKLETHEQLEIARFVARFKIDSKKNEPSTSVLYSSIGILVDLEPTLARVI